MRHFLIIASLMVLGCNRGSDGNAAQPTPNNSAGSCSLDGSWKRCTKDGDTHSTLVELTINGNHLAETISSFSSADDCSGTPAGSFDFSGTVTLGALGTSTVLEGGTDATLNVEGGDLFGCGDGQPAYTLMKVDASCNQFLTATTPPACSPDQRGSAWDERPFLRQ